MKHIQTLNTKSLQNTVKKGGCGECQTSCQSACKTSCTVGRYMGDEELGGAWYLEDYFGEDICLANDLFVNAWMPLPKPYREDGENEE